MHKLSGFFHKYFNILIVIYFVAALLFFKDDYFFGDAITSTSRLATYIYEQGIYFYPQGFDPGHPPTYSVLLTFCWKIFGKTLLVSHVYGIAWCVFLFLGFRKVCSLFLDMRYTNYASVLAFIHPTFISQNAMMLNTAMLMGCFLWAIYYLVSKQRIKLIFILCLMMLSHLQGAFFLAALAVADFLIHRKELTVIRFLKEKFIVYAVPFLVFIGWLIIHYQHMGWWLVSPDFTDTHESNSVFQIIKGMVYCGWRFVDYGMIVIIFLYFFLKFKNRKLFMYDTLLWTTLIVTSIIMSFVLKNTIAHRYFLGFELFLLIVVVKEISIHSKSKRIHYLILLMALMIGNFMYYPGKTIADANIQYRNFFTPYKLMLNDIQNTSPAYSKAPIANKYDIVNLDAGNYGIYPKTPLRIDDNSIDTFPCVITSNVCAEFTKEENEKLSIWYGKTYEEGAVYINIFLNPKYNEKPIGWKLREPGIFETWMIKMKQKLK